MIQDIYPSIFKNAYQNRPYQEGDSILVFNEAGEVLVRNAMEHFGQESLLKKSDLPQMALTDHLEYLFAIDERSYYLLWKMDLLLPDGFSYRSIRELRDHCSGTEVFAIFTAYHLWKWYSDNQFCGKCGAGLTFDRRERALRCPKCGQVIYPRINPAVIVGVIKGDSILITRYRTGYAHNALIAGFTEIGETLEETVAREVMEETGIRVKNITYYKSQPWGMAQDILVGYFCEADGDEEIHMDADELKSAEWVKREDILLQPTSASLTNEMMKMFRDGMIRADDAL